MVSADTLNFLLAIGTVAMHIATVGLVVLFFFGKQSTLFVRTSSLIGAWGMQMVFFLALAGSLLTLYYSEILGYPPCPLCWWQRVFLYPLVLLIGLALWRKERSITLYAITLSLAGFFVAVYHHALQTLPSGTLPCPAEGAVSCAQRFVFEFGYITFPLMAASLFAFLIAILLYLRAR